MLEFLEEPIRRAFKVPPEPAPPLGAADSLQVFRAAPAYYRYRLLMWGLGQAAALMGLAFALGFSVELQAEVVERVPRFLQRYTAGGWLVVEVLTVAVYPLQLALSFLVIALDYRYRWYLTTDRSLRIREGIWKVQEKTMTFSNIQNVSVRQGPLQRWFGIADLQVRTAGGGGRQGEGGEESAGDNLHVGRFRGVSNAAEIRDAILAQLRRLRASGLGDPDESSAEEAPGSAPESVTGPATVLEAAESVLRETRALAAAVRNR